MDGCNHDQHVRNGHLAIGCSLKMQIRRPAHHSERGQLFPFVALGAVALFGAMTLAVDVGYYRYQQRLEQSAADAAAIAGGIQYTFTPSSTTDITNAGRAAAVQNGFTDDAGVTTSVTINSPPLSGPNSGNAGYVEAIVSHKQPFFFGHIFGSAAVTVNARAVAGSTQGGLCVDSISQSTGDSIALFAALDEENGCGIASNDNITEVIGGLTASYENYVVGPAAGCSGCNSIKQIAPVANPCVAFTACAYIQQNPPSGLPKYSTTVWGGGALPAGEYTKDLIISGNTTMNGLYQFDAGVNFFAGTITGTNVTLYSPPGCTGNIIVGVSGVNMTAPTSGVYDGLVVYQDPTCSYHNDTFDYTGSGGTWTGVVYAPTENFDVNFLSFPTFGALIVNDLNVDVFATLTITGYGVTNSCGTNGCNAVSSNFVLTE